MFSVVRLSQVGQADSGPCGPALAESRGRRLVQMFAPMKAAIFPVLVLPLTVAASDGQELVVAEHAYYLDGEEAQELTEFNLTIKTDVPVMIEACVDVDISRLTAAMDWLTEKGREELAVRSVREKEQALCAERP